MRKFDYQEEIKVLMSEVFRDGDLTDSEWTEKYEALKHKTPLFQMGNLMRVLVDQKEFSIDEARNYIKGLLVNQVNASKVQEN